MAITVEIPRDAEEALRREWGDLEKAARESLLIESYRTGRLSLGLLAQTLGIPVVQADQWLAEHRVPLNYTQDDLESDRRTLRDLLGKSPA